MNNLHATFFHDNGFLVIPNWFQTTKKKEILQDASDVCLQEIKNLSSLPTSKETASEWIRKKSRLQSSESLILLFESCRPLVERHVVSSCSLASKNRCQIAARFPGEGLQKNQNWHIDNFTEKDLKRNKLPPEFDLLLGIYLTDNVEPNAGNFTVFPGTHIALQAWFAKNNYSWEKLAREGLTKISQEKDLSFSNPWQIQAPEGSIVLANRWLPHLISAPNESKQTRVIVWFRIRGARQNILLPCDPWFNYDVLKVKLNLSSIVRCPEMQEIELSNYGQLVRQEGNVLTLRLRQNHSEPNLFASRVQMDWDRKRNLILKVHTQGFLSATGHVRLASELQTHLKTGLFHMAHWLFECDYGDLITKWFSVSDLEDRDDPDGKEVTLKWKFHHLHSRSKSTMMLKWAKELLLACEITKGSPGHVMIQGKETRISCFQQRFACLHWKKCWQEKVE